MSAIVNCPNCGKKNRVPAAASGYPRCGVCKSAVPWIVDAGDADFAEVVEQAPQMVLVDLWATWCGPCQFIGPKFVAMAEDFTNVKFIKVDVDACSEVAEYCSIQAMPTFQVFKNSQKVEELVGANEVKLRELVEKYNSPTN